MLTLLEWIILCVFHQNKKQKIPCVTDTLLRILSGVVWCEWHPLEDSNKNKRRERERERGGGCFGFGFYVGERSEGYRMPFYSFKPSGYWERFVLFQFGWELISYFISFISGSGFWYGFPYNCDSLPIF